MRVVIVGGGHAGVQTADSLRAGGHSGPIDVIADEPGLPYQRPPLSKDYMAPGTDPAPLPLRGRGFLNDKEIRLHEGIAVESIDRAGRSVRLESGAHLGYDRLVLATGSANRKLSCPGAELAGIHSLKTLPDAKSLHVALGGAINVVVIGAGFIGLEFAATARARGLNVTVLEFAERIMGRALSRDMGEWFAAAHADLGIGIRLGEGIQRFEAGPDGRVAMAISTTGNAYPADLVVIGVGVSPNTRLAGDAGLEVDNGIVVDEGLRTSDPTIYAVGDCANFPSPRDGSRIRLESVQNATDHGRHAARSILGDPEPFRELPWFWSVQGPHKLQIAGLGSTDDETAILGDMETGKFSVLAFRDGVLAAVESANAPAHHIAARKLLGAGAVVLREETKVEGFTLGTAAKRLAPVA